MFGYFRPYAAIRKTRQKRAFNAHYCRLCYCLRKIGGQKARAFTTFDVTVYGMIVGIVTGKECPPLFPCQRLRKGNMNYFATDEFGMTLARISLIAFGEKLRDDEIDGDNSFKKRFARSLYKKIIRKADEELPAVKEIARRGNDEVNELQKMDAPLDEVLYAYGRAVADIMQMLFGDLGFGYDLIEALAEWTFFVDMLCDYDEDVKEKNPNTLYRADSSTIKEFFDKHYSYLIEQNERIAKKVVIPLDKIANESHEWFAIKEIITYALDTVVDNIVKGEDVQFHYVKELFGNLKSLKKSKKKKKLLEEKQ